MIGWSIIVFIIILGLLVIVHELGHFLLAKLFRVGVDEFGIGFPPRLTGWKLGQTLYSINWIPIGGFVKIKGVVGGDQMDSPTHTGHTQPSSDDFASRPLWQRFCILVGGIVMNIVLAAVLFSSGYMIGLPTSVTAAPSNAVITERSLVVVDVPVNVPAANEGLQPGDIIRSLNGQTISTLADLQAALAKSTLQSQLTLAVERQAETITELTITPTTLTESDTIGIGAYFVETGLVRLPFFTAIWFGTTQAVHLTWQILLALIQMIAQLFTGQGVSGQLAGPLGIASLTHQATLLGVAYIIQFAAVLSINLAIFNLLPFPALDGGRILFLGIELVLRRPLNQRAEAIIHNIGFIVLLLLILGVTVKDVFNLF
ncbi:MAG: RIP metalloprotease RseP [Candidatus Kerfeldbacteria bacterium]|nr:RIP metalloprotease RseP [Candidatus Kerfeldbacteria bacterium]